MNNNVAEADQYCAVCLQSCHHPTQLPCGHIFCFLCVKGVTIQSRKCAMCRAEIPPDYLNNPVVLDKIELESKVIESDDVYQWYYEGRNGWWKYDERSNVELETAFNAGSPLCTLLLAGAVYCIDFGNMVQVRRTDPTKRRRVRRDKPTLQAKGIAGIKLTEKVQEKLTEPENNALNIASSTSQETIVIPDDDVTFISTTASAGSPPCVTNLIQRLSSMDLTEPENSANLDTEDT